MKRRYTSLLSTGLIVFGAASVVSPPARAEGGAETAQAASGGLEEVIVTAQKRQENVQEVPIAINAFNEHLIDSMQITSIDTLAQFSPGLNLSRNIGAAYLSLRGVILTGITVGVDPTVAVYIDGVYNPSGAATNFTFNNIASVEVDKGPQGTLFGRNAVGGVVAITTKTPQQTPHIDFNIGYANYDTVSGTFYGTTGITSNLAADLAIYAYNQGEGWGKDLYTGQDVYQGKEWSGRSKWLFTPDDATRITFIADYDRSWIPEGGTTWARGVSANISPVPTTGPFHVGGFYDVYANYTPSSQNEQYGLSLKIDHDFGWAEGVSITSWRRDKDLIDNASSISIYPNMGLPGMSASATQNDNREATSSQEFQVLSPASSTLKWIGGIFLFQDEAGQDPYHTTFLNGSPTTYNIDQQNTTSYAGFGQATAPIMPDTRVTLGYRYTIDKRSVHGTIWSVAVPGAMGVAKTTASQSKQWPKATYKLALDHDFATGTLGYVSYSRGFESGSFNVITGPQAAPVNPETLDSYEAGLKTDLLDHKMRINTSVFYYDFRNLIVSQHLQNPPATVMSNAAEATFKGIDLDVTVVPTSNLTLQAGLELLDPYYKSFPNATVFVASSNPLSNTTTTGDDTGNQVAYSEKATGNVNAQYRIPTDMGDFQLAGDVTYHSGLVFDPQNLYRQNSYFLTNASLLWTAPSGQYDVKLWGKNLANIHQGSEGQAGANPAAYQAQAPLTVGINLGYHWN